MKNWPPSPRRSHRLKDIGIIVSLALLGLGWMVITVDGPEALCIALMAGAMVVLFLGVGQCLLYCCCPHCGKSFNIRARFPDFCPHCGTKMED